MQIYFRYVVVLTYHEDYEETKEYWCSEANAKFTEPRILSMWQGKTNVYGIFRVYADSRCTEIKGR